MKNGIAKKAAHEYRLEQARKMLEAAGYVLLPGTGQYVKLAELSSKQVKAIRRWQAAHPDKQKEWTEACRALFAAPSGSNG